MEDQDVQNHQTSLVKTCRRKRDDRSVFNQKVLNTRL